MFVVPAILLVTIQLYVPLLMSLYYSFTNWNGVSPTLRFIGLKNFVQLFKGDSTFFSTMIFTLKFTVLFVVIVNVLAMLLAIALDQKLKTVNFLRAAFFMPYIMSLIIVGFIWKFMFNQGFTYLSHITKLSVFGYSWLGTTNLAFIAIVFVSIWQAVGFYMVIYIAGLQSIQKDVLEAATVDGANAVQKFFHVTLPMLMPSITICVFLALTNAIKLFDVIMSLTGSAPAGTTASITYDIYREEFQNDNFGYGASKALVLFIIVAVLTLLQITLFKRKEVEV